MQPTQELERRATRQSQRMIHQECNAKVSARLSGRKILVAHDSPEITATVHDTLQNAGARVTETSESYKASLLIAWGGYDLVFLDAALPAVDEIMELIRCSNPGLQARTVVLTADMGDAQEIARLRRRYSAFVFQPSLLIDLVDLAEIMLFASEQLKIA